VKTTKEKVKYPYLLILTQVILSIFILIMFSRIIYKVCHYAFNFEMSWYFINDIPYIGFIIAIVLIGGFILEEYLSNLKK